MQTISRPWPRWQPRQQPAHPEGSGCHGGAGPAAAGALNGGRAGNAGPHGEQQLRRGGAQGQALVRHREEGGEGRCVAEEEPLHEAPGLLLQTPSPAPPEVQLIQLPGTNALLHGAHGFGMGGVVDRARCTGATALARKRAEGARHERGGLLVQQPLHSNCPCVPGRSTQPQGSSGPVVDQPTVHAIQHTYQVIRLGRVLQPQWLRPLHQVIAE
mmetsp:Transcript_76233/g.246868  ORF Transcript_76233/g.246868 Transcript_76233/m.246868 type:complete len:214 (-) Transcript_76233:1414-2055(-)